MDVLRLKGVRTHNLKDVSLDIPLHRLICITGPSGSGKSSLAFDTIYQEGRRRYLKALALSEQGPTIEEAPVLREAAGLPPTVALAQKLPASSPRSTVGTITGVLDFLRVLFSEIGQLSCPSCGKEARPLSVSAIAQRILSLPPGTKLYLLAPLADPSQKALRYLQGEGFSRFLIDGKLIDLTEEDLPSSFQQALVVVDRLIIKPDLGPRLIESIRLATSLSGGLVKVHLLQGPKWTFSTSWQCTGCGKTLPELRPEIFSFNHPLGACDACAGLGEQDQGLCPQCKGKRLKPLANLVKIGEVSFVEMAHMPLKGLHLWLKNLNLVGFEEKVFQGLRPEIESRLEALMALGLEELSLFQPVARLSTGEQQRLRLAALLANRLSGCLYVLDEPGLALSPKEKELLLLALQKLLAQGNTVIMVEHDPKLIRAADVVVECGPGAGEQGGQILFVGPPEDLARRPELPTGAFWAGQKRLSRQKNKRISLLNTPWGRLPFPSPGLLVLCGASGAGKTQILQKLFSWCQEKGSRAEYIRPVETRGTKSIPISYIGAYKPLRELFAQVPEARMRGFKASHFSFFSPQGRCPLCRGQGEHEINVPLAPSFRVVCEECAGTGFRRDVLDIKYRGFNIAEVLNLTVTQARDLFSRVPAVCDRLGLLEEVGLGYLRLGQPFPSLSGGERQRLVLARTLAQRPKGNWLFFDLPTLGLHLVDVQQLLNLFDRLIEAGQTLVVAEHHPGLVLLADVIWEIAKGNICFSGPPKDWLETNREFARLYEPYKSLIT